MVLQDRPIITQKRHDDNYLDREVDRESMASTGTPSGSRRVAVCECSYRLSSDVLARLLSRLPCKNSTRCSN
jgi:hypothetical protein